MKHLFFSLSLFFILPLISSGQVEFTSSKQTGLQIYTAKTVNGTVQVNLPDKLYPGETISGTVISEPKTSPKARKEKLSKALFFAQTLTILGIPLKLDEQSFRLTVPDKPDEAGAFVRLISENGTVSQTGINTMEGVRASAGMEGPLFPGYLRAGEYQNIPGNFDGVSSNTGIMLGEFEIPVVAESPGEIVTMVPENMSGRHELTIKEGDKTYSTEIGVVDLNIATNATNLRRGEHSVIHVNVTGLDDVGDPVTVFIENHTPMNISIAGGNYQEWIIDPSETGFDGIYHRDIDVTAISSGDFSVSAQIAEPFPADIMSPDEDGPQWQEEEVGDVQEDNGICGKTWSSEWKNTGKTVRKLVEGEKTEVRRNRSRCNKCKTYVDWVYYQIPEYIYNIQERMTYTCTMQKGHSSICHGAGIKENREVKTGQIVRYKEVREGSCGCNQHMRWVRKKK